jgi:hypothetical protein
MILLLHILVATLCSPFSTVLIVIYVHSTIYATLEYICMYIYIFTKLLRNLTTGAKRQ